MKESPIFTRLHDLLRWLLQRTRKFPRDLRFALAERLVAQGFALQDALVAASLDHPQKARHLLQADIQLNTTHRNPLLSFLLFGLLSLRAEPTGPGQHGQRPC